MNLLRSLIGPIVGTKSNTKIALTFDDGPHPEYTRAIVDVLARYKVRATFFMIGEFAIAHPEIVAEVERGKHALGNHSWDHPSFSLLSWDEKISQIKRCRNALNGRDNGLFRPPYGNLDTLTMMAARSQGYRVISWGRITGDWETIDSDQIYAELLTHSAPGEIVLLHDRLYDADRPHLFDRRNTIDALERYLRQVADNIEFVTLPEMLSGDEALVRGKWDFRTTRAKRAAIEAHLQSVARGVL